MTPDHPPVLAGQLGFLLKRAQLAFKESTDAALAPLGIDGRELAVLRLLGGEGPRPQQRLSERLQVDRTTMVALVDALEEKGLVERGRDARDRRAYAVALTAKGKRTLGRAEVDADRAEGEFLAPLPAAERRRLKEALARLI